ncbi:MAG: hypothetical protein IK029_01380 [Oscillospiraceae bacterium]|nr:hypothetical protein [Oscillospiraceae bacterium]
MYAEFNSAITVRGTLDELAAIAEVLWESRNQRAWIRLIKIDINGEKRDIFFSSKESFLSIVSEAKTGFEVEADGPYGRFAFLDEVGLFTDLADAAPNAYYDGKMYGDSDGAGCSESAYAELKDGTLSMRYEYEYRKTGTRKDSPDWKFDIYGMEYCILGEFRYFTKEELENVLSTEREAWIVDEITEDTDFLICNDRDRYADEVAKANEQGVEILSELDFIRRSGFAPESFDKSLLGNAFQAEYTETEYLDIKYDAKNGKIIEQNRY